MSREAHSDCDARDLPPPPVPADADLKDFAFTPIFRARLFGSAFHARSTDAEWRAGVTLWLKAQDQTPAGSLPDDDIELSRLAELGRDLRTWRKVKKGALHGWYKCNDGRLYNDVVAEVINEQWVSKLRQRWMTECARLRKAAQRAGFTPILPSFDGWRFGQTSQTRPLGHGASVPRDRANVPWDNGGASTGTEVGRPTPVPVEKASKRREEKRIYINTPLTPHGAKGGDDPAFERFWEACPRREARGKAVRAWQSAVEKASTDEIIAGMQRYAETVRGHPEADILLPATWLRDERWADARAERPEAVPDSNPLVDYFRGRLSAVELVTVFAHLEVKVVEAAGLIIAPTAFVRDRIDHRYAAECKAALRVSTLVVVAVGQKIPQWAPSSLRESSEREVD